MKQYEAIVIGVSTGGLNALKFLFSGLPSGFRIPMIIVQHLGARSENEWISLLKDKERLNIREADEKEVIENKSIYLAPANYHLLIEKNRTFSLTIDERVNFARPSIDVLFESAAEAYRDKLIGIVLTGANNDGAKGLAYIKEWGGLTIVQDPATAEAHYMPAAAMALKQPDHVLSLENIVELLIQLEK